eukprot:snap_masked-scaffold_23-processed-gene-4.23-mRNA-1 protein AED:1.00 eAED:1.00 QI:0/-1/0/0/-1/1/1/0/230
MEKSSGEKRDSVRSGSGEGTESMFGLNVEGSFAKKATKFRRVSKEEIPSLENILSVVDIIENEILVNEFAQFLRDHLAWENLLFARAVDWYKNLAETDLEEKGRKIISWFVEDNSELWINLPAKQSNKLINCELFTHTTFDEAKDEVVSLMQNNFFDSFKHHLQQIKTGEIELEQVEEASMFEADEGTSLALRSLKRRPRFTKFKRLFFRSRNGSSNEPTGSFSRFFGDN